MKNPKDVTIELYAHNEAERLIRLSKVLSDILKKAEENKILNKMLWNLMSLEDSKGVLVVGWAGYFDEEEIPFDICGIVEDAWANEGEIAVEHHLYPTDDMPFRKIP